MLLHIGERQVDVMKAKSSTAVATHALKLLPACLFAAAIAFGTSSVGHSPLPAAGAAPNDLTWDIEAYDDCISKTIRDANQCCVDSGGVPTDEPLGDGKGQKCAAPPAEQQAEPLPTPPRGPRPLPPDILLPPGNLPTLVTTG